jgi:hypothetical protein
MGLCIHSSTHYVIPVWEEKQNVQTSFVVRMLSTLAVSCLQLQIIVCNRKKERGPAKDDGREPGNFAQKIFQWAFTRTTGLG